MSAEEVSGSSRDSGADQPRCFALPAEKFLRSFLEHVLPKGFRRVRTYGWLSPAAKVRRSRLLTDAHRR